MNQREWHCVFWADVPLIYSFTHGCNPLMS